MGTKYRQSLLLFLIQFTSIHFILISSAYVPPTEYFINCGSNQDVTDNRRIFTGDESRHSVPFTFTNQRTSPVATPNQPLNGTSIYNTARIFRQQSSYSFKTNATASTYLVRLHFSAFNSDLSGAVFDVTTSSAVLLHNFRSNSTPSVMEFFVRVNASTFGVYFTPSASSLAFVNAIEFFPSPPLEFNLSGAATVGGSTVLRTVYRINVGGERIYPVSDEIWRNWDTDDEFLKTTSNAVDTLGNPNSRRDDSQYWAPDLVYRTATKMNETMNNSNLLTWTFGVNKSSGHLVRAHFCDIVGTSLNTILFNLYINGNFTKGINGMDMVSFMAQPVYIDTVVGSVSSGVLNISVGPAPITINPNAFLNGLEILEIKQGTASVPFESAASGGAATGSKLPTVIGAVAGSVAALCALAVAVFFIVAARRRKAKKTAEDSSWGQLTAAAFGDSRMTEGTTTINGSPVPNLNLGLKISFSEIQQATKNFNSKMIVGRGGFGNVYKGTLVNGTRVAVKRSNPGSGQGLFEFHTEIMVLSSIRHRHLVSLIGYCDEKGEMILVYEYMENGTLRDHLYNSDRPKLTWKQRLEICIGSAGGLNYLHKGSAVRIIHRDVKSTNILLDENFVAKVADFGLSKAGPLEDTHVSTNVKGTLGYWDPEYFKSQQLTEKSDVYSFGVVLMEVLCARPAIDTALPREQVNLAEWSLRCKRLGVLGDIVDHSIRDQINPNSLRTFAETAEKCLQEDGSDRPAMSDVLWDLEYALQFQQTPAAREPHEDSTVATASGFSAAIVAPDFGRIPSLGGGGGDDDSYLMSTDFTEMSASEVFSQLKRDGGR